MAPACEDDRGAIGGYGDPVAHGECGGLRSVDVGDADPVTVEETLPRLGSTTSRDQACLVVDEQLVAAVGEDAALGEERPFEKAAGRVAAEDVAGQLKLAN